MSGNELKLRKFVSDGEVLFELLFTDKNWLGQSRNAASAYFAGSKYVQYNLSGIGFLSSAIVSAIVGHG